MSSAYSNGVYKTSYYLPYITFDTDKNSRSFEFPIFILFNEFSKS